MTAVRVDIADGVSMTETFEADSATEVYDVSGILTTGQQALNDALNDPGIPAKGDAHSVKTWLIVRQKQAKQLKPGVVRVVVSYNVPDSTSSVPNPPQTGTGTIELGATVQQVKTSYDVTGTQMTLSHTYNPGTSQAQTVTVGAEADIFIPQHVLREVRLENASPHSIAKTYVGKINSLGIWGYFAKELLCTRITGTSNDGGTSYTVTYEFQYNADTWDALLVYKDKKTGVPPTGLVNGTGKKTFVVYPSVDFSGLNLSF